MGAEPIPDPVDAAVNRVASSAPLMSTTDGRTLTADALETAVAERAGGLLEAGIQTGDRVAIDTTDRLEAVLTILATIRADAVAVPLAPSIDDATRHDRIEAAAIDYAVTDTAADGDGPRTIAGDLAAHGGRVAATTQPPDQPRTIMFTSGTTGEPSPIIHTAANHDAAATIAVNGLSLDSTDRWIDPLGLHHMGGLAPIIRCLPRGIEVVLSTTVAPSALFETIDGAQATIASVVPTMVHRALEADQSTPEHLRCLLVGGAPLRQPLFNRARSAGLPVYASYGLTETVGQVATATPTERERYPGTVGRALPDVTVRVVDPSGHPVAPGEAGTIVIEGPTVSPSVGDPTPNGGRLATRDHGRIDADGRVWIHGRLDGAIQTGGKLVHPAQVEATLTAHPDIEDVGVVGLPDPTWGERVVAAVVGEVDPEALRTFAREELASHAIPRSIQAVSAIPRTPSGTVDRSTLRSRLST